MEKLKVRDRKIEIALKITRDMDCNGYADIKDAKFRKLMRLSLKNLLLELDKFESK